MYRVSALFTRSDSVYFELLFDVWDARRDARLYAGPWPVIAHPPCRGWGSLRKFAKPGPGELECAFYAIDSVRQWGGVLEHPQGSSLWPCAGLPRPGEVDAYGGFTVLIDQGWFGHFAPKPTWLYVVGMPRHHFPAMPVHDLRRRTGRTLDMLPADRERTPWLLAEWLVRLAARCHVGPGRTVTRVDRALLPASRPSGYVDLVDQETSAGAEQLLRPGGGRYDGRRVAVTPEPLAGTPLLSGIGGVQPLSLAWCSDGTRESAPHRPARQAKRGPAERSEALDLSKGHITNGCAR